MLFFYLILGFALAFYALMIEQVCIEVLQNVYYTLERLIMRSVDILGHEPECLVLGQV